MGRIRIATEIQAPVDRVFDLARDIDLHRASMAATGESAVGGRTQGLIGPGETVTWRARHFGVTMELTSRITAFDRPHAFIDEQVDGPFAAFRHEHLFSPIPGGTRMTDDWRHASPLGWLGRIVDAVVLDRYMRRQVRIRAAAIKRAAESAPGGAPAEDQPAASAAPR
jgi:ligand-binding SRPBCC domain-containing protein